MLNLNEIPDGLIKVRDIARLLNVHRLTIYRWNQKGVLNLLRINGRLYGNKKEIYRLLGKNI
jgi:excisionase family DNA binding protein